jgi:hypothetical protein
MHAVGLLARCGAEAAVSSSRDAVAVDRPVSYLDVQAAFAAAWSAGARVYPSTVRGLSRPTPLLGVVGLAGDADTAGRLVDRVVEAIADPAAARA